MTAPGGSVALPADAAYAACSAYSHALVALDVHATSVPGYRLADPATHVEAHAVRAALPYVLRDELRALLDASFGSGDDGDTDYHYALEALRDGVVARLAELERFTGVAAATAPPGGTG